MWVLADRWVVRLVTLASFLTVSHILGPDLLGDAAWLVVLMMLSGLLVETGPAAVLLRERDSGPRGIVWQLVLASIGLIAITLLAAALMYAVGSGQYLAPLATVPGHLVLPINAVAYSVLVRRLAFRTLALRRFASQAGGAIAGVIAALHGAGASSLGWQYSAAAIISAALAITVPAVRDSFTLRPASSTSWRRGGALSGIALVPFLSSQLIFLLLPVAMPSRAAGVLLFVLMLFNVAQDVLVITLGSPYWPLLAKILPDVSLALHVASVTLSLAIALTVAGFGATILLYPLVAGTSYAAGLSLLMILLGTLPGLLLVQLDRGSLLAAGKTRREFRVTVTAAGSIILPIAAMFSGTLPLVGVAYQARTCFMLSQRAKGSGESCFRLVGMREFCLVGAVMLLGGALSVAVSILSSIITGSLAIILMTAACAFIWYRRLIPDFAGLYRGVA